jgi:maltose alpha-D-glucosyltransferase/alpha-amylase
MSGIADEQRLPPELSRDRRGAPFIPKDEHDLQVMLEAYLLDKAIYEVGYELNNRPDWVVIPIRGIKHILQKS